MRSLALAMCVFWMGLGSARAAETNGPSRSLCRKALRVVTAVPRTILFTNNNRLTDLGKKKIRRSKNPVRDVSRYIKLVRKFERKHMTKAEMRALSERIEKSERLKENPFDPENFEALYGKTDPTVEDVFDYLDREVDQLERLSRQSEGTRLRPGLQATVDLIRDRAVYMVIVLGIGGAVTMSAYKMLDSITEIEGMVPRMVSLAGRLLAETGDRPPSFSPESRELFREINLRLQSSLTPFDQEGKNEVLWAPGGPLLLDQFLERNQDNPELKRSGLLWLYLNRLWRPELERLDPRFGDAYIVLVDGILNKWDPDRSYRSEFDEQLGGIQNIKP